MKRSLSAKPEKGFYLACEDIKPNRRFVVYSGEGPYRASQAVEVIGLRELMELMAA